METGKESIFRKTSLERLSSPEDLSQYIQAIKPMYWVMLLGVLAFVTGACIWCFVGVIPETVTIEGVAYSESGGDVTQVYAYLPLTIATRLSTGMEAQVSPTYAGREEYGYIRGTVAEIGSKPVNRSELAALFGDISYVEGLVPEGNVVEVRLSLEHDGDTLSWSNERGNAVRLEQGAYCLAQIVIRRTHPAELVFGGR